MKEQYFYYHSKDHMPNFTLQDVLSHPAYTRFVMSKTRAEIESMRDILVILLKCGKVLHLYKSHRLKEITPERRASEGNFTHFLECVWADDSTVDGPDTCVCNNVSTQCQDIIKFLDERFCCKYSCDYTYYNILINFNIFSILHFILNQNNSCFK